MKNNKGQALVEFVLVLPILLFAIMALIDVASIFFTKYKLEDNLDYIVELYEEGSMTRLNEYANSNKIIFELEENSLETTIKVKKTQKINTPILKEKLGNNYEIETERTIYIK
jgi:uncharacterized protein (UPF0333 family)